MKIIRDKLWTMRISEKHEGGKKYKEKEQADIKKKERTKGKNSGCDTSSYEKKINIGKGERRKKSGSECGQNKDKDMIYGRETRRASNCGVCVAKPRKTSEGKEAEEEEMKKKELPSCVCRRGEKRKRE